MAQPLSLRHLQRPDAFNAAIAPVVTLVHDLLDTEEELRETYRHSCASGSAAESELNRQTDFAGEWGNSPVADAHSIVWLLIATAQGHMRSVLDLVASERTGPASVDTLVRAALECLARAHWLVDPSVSLDERLKRAQTERLYSATEQKNLADTFHKEAEGITSKILQTGQDVGWTTLAAKRGKPPRFVERPSATNLVRDLFRGDDSSDLGTFSYRLLSASAHGTIYGLVRYAHVVEDLSVDGVTIAAIAFNAREVSLLLEAALMAQVNMLTPWFRYLGWDAEAWIGMLSRVASLRNGPGDAEAV